MRWNVTRGKAGGTRTHQINTVSTSTIATILVVAGSTFHTKATETDMSEKTYIHQQSASCKEPEDLLFILWQYGSIHSIHDTHNSTNRHPSIPTKVQQETRWVRPFLLWAKYTSITTYFKKPPWHRSTISHTWTTAEWTVTPRFPGKQEKINECVSRFQCW